MRLPLVQDYKRRRLGQHRDGPAWFEAVAEDVPSVSAWWRASVGLSEDSQNHENRES